MINFIFWIDQIVIFWKDINKKWLIRFQQKGGPRHVDRPTHRPRRLVQALPDQARVDLRVRDGGEPAVQRREGHSWESPRHWTGNEPANLSRSNLMRLKHGEEKVWLKKDDYVQFDVHWLKAILIDLVYDLSSNFVR